MLKLLPFLLVFLSSHAFSQINPEAITIIRDKWGIPHIMAKTDAEVAYGFAWATAEDDFHSMQITLLPTKGLLGLAIGKEGAFLDVAAHLLDIHQIVEEKYEQDLTPEFRKVLEGYAEGINAYAKTHPDEVMVKKAFPITGRDIIKGYVMGMSQMAGTDRALRQILGGKIEAGAFKASLPEPENATLPNKGSNGIAVSGRKTADGKTYLAINSHQPLEGPTSWYEAHLMSEEGWNIIGAAFPGGVSIFVGANEYLGWAHTVNYPDLADIYELKMHPTEALTYRFDGKWEKLRPYHTKARIKALGFLKIGLKQKFYKSKYGVTFETDNGFFSLRHPANRDIKAAEQWYRMNKAQNFEQFRDAIKIQGLTSFNIVYADRDDHIYYVSNGRFPKRDPYYKWDEVLPGDTSATLWQDDIYPMDSLPHVIDPPSGFVYNCNQTPFLASGPNDHPRYEDVPKTMGFQKPTQDNNRSTRIQNLMKEFDDKKMTYEDFKRVKFDRAYHKPLKAFPKLEAIFHLDANKYSEVAESIQLLSNWDRVTSPNSEAASIFILSLNEVSRKVGRNSLREGDELTDQKLVAAIKNAETHLLTHFGKKKVPLGELQRHTRGNVSLPLGGGPDVLAAIGTRTQENGRLRARAGESYISLVRFSDEGPEIESINAYGTSAHPDSPHYTDQMEMYTKQQLRPMSLDKETVIKQAVKKYHPGGSR